MAKLERGPYCHNCGDKDCPALKAGYNRCPAAERKD